MNGSGIPELLASFHESGPVIERLRTLRGEVVAVGWATVELDRAIVQLATALRLPIERFVHAEASSILGARCLVAADAIRPGFALVLLEPNTEGRLAATLARHDEGPAVAWLAVDRRDDAVASLRQAGIDVASAQAGPFGTERLILDSHIHGPHHLVIERPGTIAA